MKTKILLIIGALTLFTAGCDNQSSTTAAADASASSASADSSATATATDNDAKLIATINAKKIFMSDFETFATQRIAENPQLQQAPQVLLNELINRELLVQTAEAEGLHERADVQAQIKNERDSIILATLLDEKLANTDLTDEALKSEYDLQLNNTSSHEYQTSHILVADQATAQALITQLQSGSDFATLARENSTGPTKDKGGDLGWILPETMVPQFASELVKLDTGAYTQTPVQTRFGWHVIKLNNKRELTPPTFEDSKERLRSIVANKAAQQYLGSIRQDSKIDIYDPATGEIVSAPAAAAAEPAATAPAEN